MEGGLVWLWLALFSSLISAQNTEMNRKAGQEGFRLNLWRMGISSCFWLPLALLQPWPSITEHAMYYFAAVGSGVGLIIGFTIQTELSLHHNSRVAVLHMPLKALLVFLIWALFNPEARVHYFENIERTLGILACLTIMAGALFAFRRNDVSWYSFKAVLPIVGIYGAFDIFTKLTMPPGNFQANLIVFLFVMTFSSVVASLLYLPWRPRPELPLMHPKLMRAGGWAAVGGTINQTCFFGALLLGPSPAYVSMVALLTPVWLLAYHRIAGIKDDASPVAGMFVVVAAMILMWLVA
jgi:drug/metabolite transporter (DMT)-like permease